MSKATNEGLDSRPVTESEINVNWINAGLYWNFWFFNRLSVLGGLQRIIMDDDEYNTGDIYTFIQNQWAAGLEYRVKEGGFVTATIGQINGARECDNTAVDLSDTDFRQLQVDLFLTVAF